MPPEQVLCYNLCSGHKKLFLCSFLLNQQSQYPITLTHHHPPTQQQQQQQMISYEEACCLALDLVPLPSNFKHAVEVMEATPFDVVYEKDKDPKKPTIVAKTVIEKNPFTWQKYKSNGASETQSAESSNSSKNPTINYSGTAVLQSLKAKYTMTERHGSQKQFVTLEGLYNELKQAMPNLSDFYSVQQIGLLLNNNSDYFGKTTKSRVDGKPKNGRWLYVVKKVVQHTPDPRFLQHCKSAHGNWINVGYARKSPSDESEDARIRLLSIMIKKLQNIMLCSKIYVSPTCKSTSSIVRRDDRQTPIIAKLKNTNGTMQDLLEFVSRSTQKIRLCVLDYAGLSDDPVDVKKFIRYESVSKLFLYIIIY
ncbi:hypothetical protein BDA99DRAFT_500460 [Phascolomyces articulosus]|uniref:Uncharacterized protein n=1 Tax=Phascolomyces articulosus TaxID=60185 RepID=A0AAD5K6B4_9FUNG|nr:hypothetical protein BDA99DRAFT_500460 [Phascolomyces articulosus]